MHVTGLGVLFGKLQQGVVENQQVLMVARLRADAEELYGTKLGGIPTATEKNGGFGRDDGATARQVCPRYRPSGERRPRADCWLL